MENTGKRFVKEKWNYFKTGSILLNLCVNNILMGIFRKKNIVLPRLKIDCHSRILPGVDDGIHMKAVSASNTVEQIFTDTR